MFSSHSFSWWNDVFKYKFCSPFQLCSRGSMLLSSPPASSSAGHVTRDQPVMTRVTLTWRGFSRLNVTNYEYIQGTINLFNCPGKVISRARQQKTQRTWGDQWPVVSCVQWPGGRWEERRSDYDWHLSRGHQRHLTRQVTRNNSEN